MGCCRLQRHLVKVKDEIGGGLRQLSQEFKVEAVKLVTERVQAARDLERTARQVYQSCKRGQMCSTTSSGSTTRGIGTLRWGTSVRLSSRRLKKLRLVSTRPAAAQPQQFRLTCYLAFPFDHDLRPFGRLSLLKPSSFTKMVFTRFNRHISTSISKLFECQRAQLV